MIIVKELRFDIDEIKKNISELKKDWKNNDIKIIVKLFNFNQIKKNKNIELGLDFRNLKKNEQLLLDELKEVDIILVNSKNNISELILNNNKLIYSFNNFSYSNINEVSIELKEIFKSKTQQEFNKKLKNIYFEIPILSSKEDEILKLLIFIKKIFLKKLSEKDFKKVKIILKTKFDKEKNQEILNNKLFKISGLSL